MWFLSLLSWIATLIQIVLLTLAVGLFYLAELVEEYTSMSAKVIRYMIFSVILVYIGLLLFENLSTYLIIAGLIQQVIHLMLLKSFPYFEFSSPAFIGTCVMLIVNHYLAFSYFNEVWHPFSEVLAIFTICLWIVPFAFFVSLSANDNTLPSTVKSMEASPILSNQNDDLLSSYFSKKPKKIGLLTMLKGAQEWIGLSFKSKKSF